MQNHQQLLTSCWESNKGKARNILTSKANYYSETAFSSLIQWDAAGEIQNFFKKCTNIL